MHSKLYHSEIEKLRSPERLQRLELERIMELCLEAGGFTTALDVGVGSGVFAGAFAARGLTVAGIDINPLMLDAAREYVPEGDFREAVAESLPFPDASFDLAFLGLVLHESNEPLKALQEARRVARRLVCILEWPFEEGEAGPPLSDRLEPAQIEKLAQQAGFTHSERFTLAELEFYRLTG